MKKSRKHEYLKNERGMGLVEVMVSLGILFTMTAIVTSTMSLFMNYKKHLMVKRAMHQIVGDLMNNLIADGTGYQVTQAADVETVLSLNNLPMAWSSKIVTRKDQCPSCPGLFGYIVRPSTTPGLFEVIVRMTHEDLRTEPNGNSNNSFVDFKFVVGGNR